jgi:hypothetical protein
MPISNPKEEIDIRVLRLIGLEDVFDLDYDTYLTLLKESMVRGRMPNSSIPTEEVELLTNEYKRVKNKKDDGRFSVKKKKIGASSFDVGSAKKLITAGKGGALVPSKAISKSPLSKSLEDSISSISSAISSIAETLKEQQQIKNSSADYDRRKSEQEKRSASESKLEKRFEGLKKVAEKIISPVKSLLDKILQFFTTILLGRIVYKVVEWMGDPKNASKLKSVIRFVKDWWPALLGSYILFGTSFGKLIRGTLGMVARFTLQLGRVAIPQLLKFIKSPLGIGAALFTAGATVPALFPGTVNQQERKTDKEPGSSSDKIKSLQQQKANLNFFDKLWGKGAEIDEQISYLQTGKTKSYGFSGGGFASGYVSGEKGVDKVPAMLSDGEFVMSRGAVEKYGVDTLEAMNSAGGGTNKPRVISGTTYAAGGGMIGRSNTPFTRDPIDAISRFIKFKFGADVGKQSTWGSSASPQNLSQSKSSTGSLMTDPIGAVARIANSMGIKTPNVSPSQTSKSGGSQNAFSRALSAMQQRGKPSAAKPEQKNMFQEIADKLKGPGAATYRNAGNIYLKQMLGGFGGPISEGDLSPESQKELKKAIERAKKRTGSEIAKAEAKIKELRAMGAKDGNPALETQKSFLKKLKAGGIRVQYTDYAENGKMSKTAENAKNILGQFWANQRSKKEGGGYRIEDRYDFDKMKDPMSVLFGKGKSTQQRLQALHQLNPLRGKGDVDMVLGGRRTAAESWGLSASKTLLGGLFGISGKPKPKAQVAKTKPKPKVVKPKPSAKPRVVYGPPVPQKRNVKGGGKTNVRPPRFSASTKGAKTKADLIGVHR